MEVVKESATNTSRVKAMLSATKAEEGELNYRAQKTLDAMEQCAVIDKASAEKLAKKIEELAVPRLKELHVHKIIDVLPTSAKDVKTLLQSYSLTITNENLQKIADACAEMKK